MSTYPKSEADLPNLQGKVIQFNSEVEKTELDYDRGMKARVVRWEDKCDGCFRLVTDFSEFKEHNEKLMQANYYDKDGQATLKWCETTLYPKDCRTGDWMDYSTPIFDVIEG